jgi:hypothetical protein
MKIRYWVQGGLLLAALAGIGSQIKPAQACNSAISSGWVQTKSCSDATTEGTSRGLSANHKLQANLMRGNHATARGLNSLGGTVCFFGDDADDAIPVEGQCPMSAVKHQVAVN